MELNYAKRFDGISGSVIRDIFKLLKDPNIISFAGGNPANSALESDVIARFAQKVLAENAADVEALKAGNAKIINALTGKVMKASNPKPNPRLVTEIITRLLGL